MKKFSFVFSLVIVGLLALSCTIGLGKAVDTAAPELEILSPEPDAVIREAFAISGNWSDDGEIASLSVTLKSTDADAITYGPFDGTVTTDSAGSGTWSIEINPLSESNPMRDGTYVATVSITDGGDHTTKQSQQFVIDNTAPIVVLQRPSSKSSDSLSSVDGYGQTFTLEGQAADDNNINLIEVKIFSDEECTDLLHTVELKNVPPTIELDVAKFVEGEDNDYSKIYGSNTKEGATTKYFYCSIVAYDSAARYPIGAAQSEEDKLGNATTHYYLYEDISGSILSDYKITEVYHMMNGTYSDTSDGERAAEAVRTVKEILDENELDVGRFSLNPRNNPTFVVSGYPELTKDGTDFSNSDYNISKGASVVLEVSTGLDAISLVSDNLKVYVLPCDLDGKPETGAEKIYPSNQAKSKSGTSWKIVTVINTEDGLAVGKNYVFGVEGADAKGNTVENSGKGYGFHLAPSGAAPDLTVTTSINGSNYSSDAIRYVPKMNPADVTSNTVVYVKGTVTTEEGEPELTIKLDNTTISKSSINMVADAVLENTYNYSCSISTAAFPDNDTSKQHTLSVMATSGLSTTVQKTLSLDKDGPSVSIESVSPKAYVYKSDESGDDDGKVYLNGKNVEVKVSIVDDFDTVKTDEDEFKPKVEFLQKNANNEWEAKAEITQVTTNNGTTTFKNIDTTKLEDNKEVLVRLTAWDRAGNKSVKEESYIVNQATDTPVAFPKDNVTGTLKFDTVEKISEQTAKNLLTSGQLLSLKLADDDGISYYELKIADAGINKDYVFAENDARTKSQTLTSAPTTYSLDYPLPEIAGIYKIGLTLKDRSNNTYYKEFFVRVTAAAPTVQVTLNSGNKYTSNATKVDSPKDTVTAAVSISSDQEPFTVVRTVKVSTEGGAEYAVYKTTLTKDSAGCSALDSANPTITDTFKLSGLTGGITGSGSYKVYYTVTDNNSKSGSSSVLFYVDNDKPEATVKSLSDKGVPTTAETEQSSFKFKGNAAVGTGVYQSDIREVQTTFKNPEDAGWTEASDVISPVGTTDWGSQVVFADVSVFKDSTGNWLEGPKSIWARAIDEVGNIGDWVKQDFVFDTNKPVFAFDSYTQDGGTSQSITENNSTVSASKKFTLKGIVSDGYGINEVEIWEAKDGGAYSKVTSITPTKTSLSSESTSYAWANLPVAGTYTGDYKYKVIATDKAGKTSIEAYVTVKIDKDAPTITISAPADKNIISGSSTVLSGTVKDTGSSGVGAYYYALTDSATAPAISTTSTDWKKVDFSTDSNTQATWELSKQIGTGTVPAANADANTIYEGEWYLHVFAVDKAGNVGTTAVTRHFYVDQKDPVISSVKQTSQSGNDLVENGNYYYNASDAVTDFVISGKILESNALSEFTISVDGGSPKPITKPAASVTAQEWTYTVTGIANNTSKEIVLYAKDKAGREDKKTFRVFKDTLIPNIEITNPDNDVDGENALSGSVDNKDSKRKYTFRGTVNDDGAGITNNTYKYLFTHDKFIATESYDTWEKAAIAHATGSTTKGNWQSFTGQSFSVTQEILSGTGDYAAGVLKEGEWYLYIYAQDKVGLENVYSRHFWIDIANPTVTTKLNGGAAVTTSDVSSVSINAADFKVEYKVEDSHGINSTTVTVKKGDGTVLTKDVDYEIGAINGGYYPVTLKNPVDGEYSFEIASIDMASKQTKVTRLVRLDTTGPVISFTSPDFNASGVSGWQTAKDVSVIGTASDVSGVSKIYYAVDKTVSLPASADVNTQSKWEAKNWTAIAGNSNWTIDLKGLTDNAAHKLYVSAVDGCGNVTAIATRTIKVDTTAPDISETGLGTSTKKVNASNKDSGVLPSGKFTETLSGIKSITITDSENAASTWTVDVTEGTTGANNNWTLANAIEIANADNKLADGTHSLTITIKDMAGNQKSIQRTVLVDTKLPTQTGMSITSPVSADYEDNSQNWYKQSSINIKVEGVVDAENYAENDASGVADVKYSTDGTNWISMTVSDSDTSVYKATVNCSEQGINTIRTRVEDTAGNYSDEKTQTVYIDTETPDTAEIVKINDSTAKLDETRLVNGTSDLEVYIYAEDMEAKNGKSSGIKHVNLSKIGSNTEISANTKTQQYTWAWYNSSVDKVIYTLKANPTTSDSAYENKLCTQNATVISAATAYSITVGGNDYKLISAGVYKVTINKADFATGIVEFIVQDNVQNKAYKYSTFQMDYDNKYPSATIKDISDADTTTPNIVDVNKVFKINGSAKDNKTLSSVKLQYASSTYSSETKKFTDGTWKDYPEEISSDKMADWTVDIDTINDAISGTKIFENGKYYAFRAVATDSAGNVGNSDVVRGKGDAFDPKNVVHVYVNQDSDRPKITFSNIGLNSMTNSNYIYLTNLDKLYGNIVDDDGIASFKYSTDGTNFNTISVSNGGFTIPNLAEGAQKIIFRVNDGTTEFTSSENSGPKLIGNDETPVIFGSKDKPDTQLYLRVNTQRPNITNMKFYRWDDYKAGANRYETTAIEKVSITSSRFGGKRFTKVKIEVDVQDENGVYSVIAYDAAENVVGTGVCLEKDAQGNAVSTADNNTHTWTIDDIDLSGNTTSGTYNYTIKAIDAKGTALDLENTDSFQIVMDMTPPTLAVTSHNNGGAIRTSFTLKGTVDDSQATMKYVITDKNDTPAASVWTTAKQYRINQGDSISNWSITFDGDTANTLEEHTYDQKTWFVNLYGSKTASNTEYGIYKNRSGTIVEKCSNSACEGNDGDEACVDERGKLIVHNKYRTAKDFYFHYQLTDAFGNTSVDNDENYKFHLKVDPQGDIPVVTMNYPIAESYAYYSTTGSCWYYESPADFDANTKYDAVKSFTVKDENGDNHTYTDFKYKGPYTSASGRISVSGTAEDDKTIKGLYMQIDPNYSPAAGFRWTAAAGSTIAERYEVEDIYNKYNGTVDGRTGIYIGNDTTWNVKLNANNEFNGTGTSNSTIAIKLLAVDEDGNVYEGGREDVLIITIDSGAPKIGETTKTEGDTQTTVGVAFSVWQYAWTNVTSGVTSIVYTNTNTPVANTTRAYTNSGCTGTGSVITNVSLDKSQITMGGKVYKASFINRAYTDGMWLNGMWWLVGSVEDESGISSIKIGRDSIMEEYCEPKTYIVDREANSDSYDYLVRYPIGRTDENAYGSLSYTLTIQDVGSSPKENSATFSINFDNKRPVLATNSDASYNIDVDVINTDGFYTIKSAVTEGDGESGFARTVIYFKRTVSGYEKIYDVFLPKDKSPIAYDGLKYEDDMYWQTATVNAINNKVLTVTTTENVHKGGIVKFGGSIYTITDKTASTITLDGEPNASLTGSSIYFGIGVVVDRKGTEGATNSAAKIESGEGKGYWDEISGDDDFMIESVTTQGTKSIWEGNINTKNIPDGPIEIHYVVYDKAGNSSHGVVTKATKKISGVDTEVNAFVKNNAPMIASVTVGTTFSGGDEPEYEETYYVSEKTRKVGGKEVKKSISVSNNVTVAGDENGTKAFMTIKDKSWVKPEIVGGNGKLSYTYKIDDGNTVSGDSLGNATIEGGEDYLNTTDENELKYVNGQILTFPITTTILNGITTNSTIDAPTTFLYTISDSTEGVAGGLTATINLKLAVNYHDIVPPKAVILPFEWNGTGKTEYSEREDNEYKVRCYIPNNSIYESELANGHIELNEDLDYTGTKFTATSGLMDKDPKVSGKISIRGYAYDDIRLSNLWIKMDNFTFTNGTAGSGKTAGYVKAASYTTADGWTSYGNISDGWKFTVFAHDGSSAYEDLPVLTETSTDADKANYEKIHNQNLGKYYGSYFNQRGHKVYWQLDLDTEKLSTVAGVDKKVYLMVEDARGTEADKYSSTENSSSRASTDEVLNTPYYQMDVVPYITKVYTKLSKQKLGSWSTYGRTALGHYTVADNETVYMYGFNLGNTEYKPKYNGADLAVPVSGKTKNSNYPSGSADESTTGEDYSSYSVLTFPVSNFTTSGELAITVNTISTLNNLNRNEAAGTSKKKITNTADKTGTSTSDKLKYAYNLVPNSDNNNILTDDLEFDVWHINGAAAKPSSGAVNDVVMKINPSNNMLGFAFVNGQLQFAMPNKNTSYTNWQKSYETYHSIGLAYDSKGDSFAVGAGGDSNGHQADLFNFLSSKMGVGETNSQAGSYNGTASLRLESIAQKIGTTINTTGGSFNVVPDRIQSPSIATSRREEANTTHVYLAYWDKINDEIRFRVGKFADNTNAKPTWGTIKDYFTNNELGGSGKTNTSVDANYGYYTPNTSQILATTTGTNKTGTNAGNNTPVLGNAGPYVSIGVVKNKTQNKDVVVMVWFDQVNKKLCYAYNTSPTTVRTGINYEGWIKGPDILKEGEGGEYCQLAVDANGGIHIAAYTGLNNEGNLKYAYLSSYDDTEPDVVTVDSNGIVGDNLTIDVATVDGKYVPYIGYYTLSMAMPKYAYKVSDEVKDGITKGEEAFNGNWEVTIVPTSSAVSPGRINVGVFKTAEGARTYSTTDMRAPTNNNIGTYNAGAGSGNCYGNGSDNPILGYAITISGTESWVETAQMK